MKKKFLYLSCALVLLVVAACGPAPEPTLSPADLASTAVADAWIAITQTYQALPTSTSTPSPTPTLLPTFTPVPTLAVTFPTATIAAATSTDPCNQPPPIEPKGTLVKVKFVNKSEGVVNLSFGMNSPNDQDECVTYTFVLGTFDTPVVTVLAGCYWAFGWVDGKEPSTAQTPDLLCVTNPNAEPDIWITKEVISFH
jgi:hypothetical protein